MKIKRIFVIFLAFMLVSLIIPNAIHGESQSVKSLSESNFCNNDDWTNRYINELKNIGTIDIGTNIDSFQKVNKADFIRWLMQAKNISMTNSKKELDFIDSNDPNYLYILTALEKGYLRYGEMFNPTESITRAEASIFLVRFLDQEDQNLANEYKYPVIPAQDGYYEVPEKAIGSLSLCYNPNYQLLGYRQREYDNYRYIEPNEDLLFGEAIYSLFSLLHPPKKGGNLNISMSTKPKSLFWGQGSTYGKFEVDSLLYEGSTGGFDQNWKTFPVMLKRFPTQENGLWKVNYTEHGEFENMEVTFEIRENLKWSDGTPITADDFVFANYLFDHPEFPVIHSETSYWLDSFEAIDSTTIKAKWSIQYLYATSGIIAMPRKYFETKYNYHFEAYDINDEDYYASDKYKEDTAFINNCVEDEEYCTCPIHAGPYKVKENKSDEKIVLEANNNYVFGNPLLQTVTLNFNTWNLDFSDEFEKGTVDVVFNCRYSLEEQIEKNPLYQIICTSNNVWEHIDLNCDNEILKDKNIRKALMYGMNRKEIASDILDKKCAISNAWLPPKHEASKNSNLTTYRYNPKKASKLLDEAGWLLSDDGYREKDGEEFAISLITTAQNQTREKIQNLIAENWEELGIVVEIETEQPTSFFTSTLRERLFDGPTGSMFAWVLSSYSNLFTLVNSSMIPCEKNEFSGQNYTAFENDEVDKLTEEIYNSLDQKKIYKYLSRIQEILTDELPSLPLYNRCDISVIKKGLINYLPSGTSSSPLWNIAYMYWDK